MATDVDPVLPPFLKITLEQDWFACTSTTATLRFLGNKTQYAVVLDDPDGLIYGALLATEDENGDVFLKAGLVCMVGRPQDATDGHYELLQEGNPCASGTSSSGSESGSESSGGGECNTNPLPRADAPTLSDWDQAWGRKLIAGRWCYGWIDADPCGS